MATVLLIFFGLFALTMSSPFPTSPTYNFSIVLLDPTKPGEGKEIERDKPTSFPFSTRPSYNVSNVLLDPYPRPGIVAKSKKKPTKNKKLTTKKKSFPVNAAEYYRQFLFEFVVTKGFKNGLQAYSYGNENLDSKGGLYFFFWKHFPLYVGITGRTFKQRYAEHEKEGGVLYKIKYNKWTPTPEGNINVNTVKFYAYPAKLPVAKFLESTFLLSFDFAMNKEENNGERPLDFITPSKETQLGKSKFDTIFMKMYNAVEKIKKQIEP